MAASLKAFVICDDASQQADVRKYNLIGAGLSHIQSPLPVESPSQRFKHTLWVFLQLCDEKQQGTGRLALMRTDSGRRYFFRPIAIQHSDPLRTTTLIVRMFDLEFPDRGAYVLELWYDDKWVVDQRLDVV